MVDLAHMMAKKREDHHPISRPVASLEGYGLNRFGHSTSGKFNCQAVQGVVRVSRILHG